MLHILSWQEKQVNWSTVPWKATSAQVVRQQLSSIRLWKDLWSHSRRIMLEGFVDLCLCYVKGSSGQSEQVVTEAIWRSSCCRTVWSCGGCSSYSNAVPSNESRLYAEETLTGWPKAKNRAGVPLWEAKQNAAKWMMKHELLGHLSFKKKNLMFNALCSHMLKPHSTTQVSQSDSETYYQLFMTGGPIIRISLLWMRCKNYKMLLIMHFVLPPPLFFFFKAFKILTLGKGDLSWQRFKAAGSDRSSVNLCSRSSPDLNHPVSLWTCAFCPLKVDLKV